MLDLTGVYAKLGRAEEHFRAVDVEIDSWLKSCEYRFPLKHNVDFTRHAIVAQLNGTKPDLIKWTLIIGDCINNLRCALDHLIYSVAKHETTNQPSADIDKLAFIIVDDPKLFMNKDNKARLKWLTPDEIEAVRRCQPFIRTHPILPAPLKILRELSNADKHRLLQTASAAPTHLDLEFASPKGRQLVHLNSEPIEDNSEICHIDSPQADPHLMLKGGSIGIEVALWHGPRDATSDPMYTRTGYAFLLPMLINEVKFAVNEVRASVT
jgi:hypothetical protein